MARRREISPGQVFRRIGGGGGVWCVTAVRKDGMGTAHATMCRQDDPQTLKTLSVLTVLDTTQFEALD